MDSRFPLWNQPDDDCNSDGIRQTYYNAFHFVNSSNQVQEVDLYAYNVFDPVDLFVFNEPFDLNTLEGCDLHTDIWGGSDTRLDSIVFTPGERKVVVVSSTRLRSSIGQFTLEMISQ